MKDVNREALNVNRTRTLNINCLSLIEKSLPAFNGSRITLVILLMGVMTGCGTVGAPIPPEDLPVAQKLLKEKEREAREKSKAIQEQKEEQTKGEEKPEGQAIPPEEVPLPPLRPVGTR